MSDNETLSGHGGELALQVMQSAGVNEIFTLNGAHVWPFYDACRSMNVPIYDTRHEQTATFAAEGLAKLTRRPTLAVLTAGPGVTNGVSAVATAQFNGAPVVVFGGRAPQGRWGSGSLQEFDHIPVMQSITKFAATATDPAGIPALVHEAVTAASTPHRGPAFIDFPMDVVFSPAEAPVPTSVPEVLSPDPDELAKAKAALEKADRPAIIAGGDLYWAGAWDLLKELAETQQIPVFANGLGRGCLPASHDLAFSRTRGLLKTDADLVIVIGTPLDFRLSFGVFGDAEVVHIVDHPDHVAGHAATAASPAGSIDATLQALLKAEPRSGRATWVEKLRNAESASRAADAELLAANDNPIKPTRIYGELAKVLDRDAVVVCDGGDFVSYAGKYVDVQQPGRWLDTGPYGCLGSGLGHAIAARVAHPDAQVVLLLGDGAAGFSLMDVDTLVRHDLPVVMVVGNNGIWGLEKHPMQMIYGYDIACDLRPTPYDEVVKALGGGGETVTDPAEIGPALKRAFDSGVPYLVNVMTDPEDAYPRTSNLA